jgi:hypothetical protein
LATNVIKMTEWAVGSQSRQRQSLSRERNRGQTARKHGIGPDGEAVADGLKQSAPLDFVLERFALDLGASQNSPPCAAPRRA